MFNLGNFDWKPELINPAGRPYVATVFCWSSSRLNDWANAVQWNNGILFRNFGENRSSVEVVQDFKNLAYVTRVHHIEIPIILTTHRIELMSNDVSRPDCIFVLQKDGCYPKPIWTLTDKEIRREHNLQKMWAGGMFD